MQDLHQGACRVAAAKVKKLSREFAAVTKEAGDAQVRWVGQAGRPHTATYCLTKPCTWDYAQAVYEGCAQEFRDEYYRLSSRYSLLRSGLVSEGRAGS